MVSTIEFLDLKNRLVDLLTSCVEHKCSDLVISDRAASKRKGNNETDASSEQALYFIFSQDTRKEMLGILERINFLLTNKLSSLPPPDSQLALSASNTQPATCWEATAVPNVTTISLSCIKTTERQERIKMATAFYLGSSSPKPNLVFVAKKFCIDLTWLAKALIDSGEELDYSCINEMPLLFIHQHQCSDKQDIPVFSHLTKEVKNRITQDAEHWMSNKIGNFLRKKSKTDPKSTRKDLFKELTEDQRRDILDFYNTYRVTVTAPWIVDQAAKKYGVTSKLMARYLAANLMKRSGKEVQIIQRHNSRFNRLEGKQEMILNYARNQRPEELSLSQIARIFGLKTTSVYVLREFLAEHGIKILTTDQRRAKKLADKGLPYTPAREPEVAKRYYENQKRVKMLSKANESDDGVKSKKRPRQSVAKRRTRSQPKRSRVQEDSELDEAISELNDQVQDGSSFGGHHQYEMRSSRHLLNPNANQFFQYY